MIAFAVVDAKRLRVHDSMFVPDYTLHVTYADAAIACKYKPSILVNGQCLALVSLKRVELSQIPGSAPGPTIVMYENRTTWVRVYNDMKGQNLTKVSYDIVGLQ